MWSIQGRAIVRERRRMLVRARPGVEALEAIRLLTTNAVLRWNTIALDAVANDVRPGFGDQAGPTRTSRALAIVQLAVFDAVNSIVRQYTPYLVQRRFISTASKDAAVAQAAHDTLSALYPKQKAKFDAALKATLDAVPDGPRQNRACAAGHFAASMILAARAHDGSNKTMAYTATAAPGRFMVFPGEPPALGPQWGEVRPFAIQSPHQFLVTPPPALNSVAYADAYNEVKNYGGDGVNTPTLRTPEQTLIGKFWAYDGTPGLGTPPRLYNQIAQVLARQQGMDVMQDARLFALVNMAMADSGIACWACKYQFDFWRPVRGIRQVGPNGENLDDGNPLTTADPNWTPLGAPATNATGGKMNFTPPFPAFDSGHATFGAALFETLKDVIGRDNVTFILVSDEYNGKNRDADGTIRPLISRTFHSFGAAAEENGQSRIYLGIHWKFDKVEGIKEGTAIADYAFASFLRPLRR
jgi:hypothetical protein